MSDSPIQPPPPEPPLPPAGGGMSDKEAYTWAMACHLAGFAGYVVPIPGANVIAPLIIWNLKRTEHPLVDDQGKESLNFQISMLIYVLVSAISLLCVVGVVLLPAVVIFDIVMVVIAAIKASQGELYRYPLTIRFVK